MNASFGIDHPLIAVNNIEVVRSRLEQIGFRMTAIGKHPWGTSTSLAMFKGSLIEIMGIYDDTLLDVNPTGDFHFGRHVYTHLQEREGVAFSALHSTNIARDITHAKSSGLTVSGTLEFGRDVTLPNGDQDRTKTTLALLPDSDHSRLSFFLCQQHRPELIYVPEWLNHPNTVYGYAGITIAAELSDQNLLRKKFKALYGGLTELDSGFSVETANGKIRILNKKSLEKEFGLFPKPLQNDNSPAIIAMDFYCQNLASVETFILNSGMKYRKPKNNHSKKSESILMTEASQIGNTYFRFIEKAD